MEEPPAFFCGRKPLARAFGWTRGGDFVPFSRLFLLIVFHVSTHRGGTSSPWFLCSTKREKREGAKAPPDPPASSRSGGGGGGGPIFLWPALRYREITCSCLLFLFSSFAFLLSGKLSVVFLEERRKKREAKMKRRFLPFWGAVPREALRMNALEKTCFFCSKGM